MKISKYFLMAAAAMSLFACSNDDEAGLDKKGEKMAMITLSVGEADTRALNTSAAGLYNNVNDLRIEFFTSNGNRLNVEIPDLTDAISELQTNQTTDISIPNVPLTATKIVVIANQKDIINTGTLASEMSSKVTLINMHDDDTDLVFNQQNSVMTGVGDVPVTVPESGKVTCTVPLKPVSARVEIGKVTAIKAPAPAEGQTVNDIKNFQVEGIFMNRFYTDVAIEPSNTTWTRTRPDLGTESKDYNADTYLNEDDNGPLMLEGNYHFMCDDFTGAPLTGVAYTGAASTDGKYRGRNSIWQVTPADGKYYGYPVLAGVEKTEELEGKEVYDVANMIVKLAVTLDDNKTYTKWITIIGYRKTDGSRVTKFERNKVYRIENLEFDQFDLTDKPYEGEKTVEVTVNVMPWELVTVIPDIQ